MNDKEHREKVDKVCCAVERLRKLREGIPQPQLRCEIPLTEGKVAIVDPEDYVRVIGYKWRARGRKAKAGTYHWSASRQAYINGSNHTVLMHRFILGITDPSIHVDHKNGDGLLNTRENLRICTIALNQANKGKKPGCTSRFKGVSWGKKAGKWVAYIMVGQHQMHLGFFLDEKEAAKAYDAAALKHFGEFARLNFPTEVANAK